MGRLAEIAEHFRRRSISLGQEGNFGTLFTYNLRLRSTYAGLASLIDNPNLSFLLEGAQGTGKSRTVFEFVRLENIFRNLLSLDPTHLVKVDHQSRQAVMTSLLENDTRAMTALYYFPSLETFTLKEQQVLCQILRRQDCRDQSYRLVFGCEESLVFMVQRGKILSELVDYVRLHSFSLPRIRERTEDFPSLLLDAIVSAGGPRELPTHQVLELLADYDYSANLDSLMSIVKQALTLNARPSTWSASVVDRFNPTRGAERTEKILDFNARLRYQ